MKIIIDAQLPKRIAYRLQELGYDTIHTLDLPLKNQTSDTEINQLSIQEQRIVISKDADFVDSFIIAKKPYKLLLISTGNISDNELEKLFVSNIALISEALKEFDYIELNRHSLIKHF